MKNITDACTDLSKAFIAGVTAHLPNATLSFDPFHVATLANTALDGLRREEVKREPELRGSRWPLLKDTARLTTKQLTTFHHLMRSGTGTARAWRLKQGLHDVFALAENASQAEALLARWYSWARRARLKTVQATGDDDPHSPAGDPRALRLEAFQRPGPGRER